MKKLMTLIFSLTLFTPAFAEETTYEQAFFEIIHICKDKTLYKELKKGSKEKAIVDCFCDNFKDYTEDEILQKYMLAMNLDIPQIDMYKSLTLSQECVNKLKD